MSFSHGHALLIGVGSYQHSPHLNVPITVADAQAVAQVLRDPRFCGYPESQVTLLHDAQASSAGILAALDALAMRAGLQDTVVLFYSGHGDFGDDGEYHLTSHETRVADGKVVAGTGISQKLLLEKLRGLRARRTLLIFNACHSGAVVPALGAADASPGQNPPDELTSALLATGAGRIIISASRAAQQSYIGAGEQTLFTQALVGGLRGQGVQGRNGYISAFDLYTHVYTTVSETVKRNYGAAQEPELTVLKGVGPFAVALYRGATALGAFDESRAPAAGAVRAVGHEESQAMLRRHVQNISGNARVGAAIAGDVHGDINLGQSGDTVYTEGGDYTRVGKISNSTGIAIGRGAQSSSRTVNMGSGDYTEGNVDKRQGTFVSGDQFNMSGDFSGAILNIKSTLNNVNQSIGAASAGDAATREQLQQLLARLSAELQKVPAEQATDAEAVAETAKQAVEQATKEKPNKTLVQISAEGLKQAAQNLATVLPAVLPLAQQIADVLRKLIGG